MFDAISSLFRSGARGPAPRAVTGERSPTVLAAYRGCSVLVSGAGGSIGAELVRQVLSCGPRKIVLFELNELALFTIELALRDAARAAGVAIVPVLGSVAEDRRLRQVLADHAVDTVLHAAAYKHVRMVEENPLAGLANNVLATQVLARAAVDAGVGRFILISSDKAVRPQGVMGATKRMAEQIVHDMAVRSPGTGFGIVRFGNVLGSSGSVVPLFQAQVARGGPVTVTDPRMERYFMTVAEAVDLVLEAGTMLRDAGGEATVFVLDMGAPVPILALARRIIEAAGQGARRPSRNGIEIVFTGAAPGEKLTEELTVSGGPEPTGHPRIGRAVEPKASELAVAGMLQAARQAVAGGSDDLARSLAAVWTEDAARASRAQR